MFDQAMPLLVLVILRSRTPSAGVSSSADNAMAYWARPVRGGKRPLG